jgi:hypothetical protein
MWQWIGPIQNDFASRADWCVKSYAEANHPPVVVLKSEENPKVKSGAKVALCADGTTDPDGDKLNYRWWQYQDAGTYKGNVQIKNDTRQETTLMVPKDAKKGDTIHVILEVSDSGSPILTRYKRVVITVK